MKPLLIGLFAFVLGSALLVTAAEKASPKAGDVAPDFEAKDQEGKVWRLADTLKTKCVLLYFYPTDDTPGCTKEACGLRDRMEDLQKNEVQVLGVSFDSAESHQKFIAKHNLNFPLLVDADGRIADAYGARMSGKDMARRVSFLIGKDGKVRHVTDVPSADTHLTEMQEAIAKLKRN